MREATHDKGPALTKSCSRRFAAPPRWPDRLAMPSPIRDDAHGAIRAAMALRASTMPSGGYGLAKNRPFSGRPACVTIRRPDVMRMATGGQRSRTAWASLSPSGEPPRLFEPGVCRRSYRKAPRYFRGVEGIVPRPCPERVQPRRNAARDPARNLAKRRSGLTCAAGAALCLPDPGSGSAGAPPVPGKGEPDRTGRGGWLNPRSARGCAPPGHRPRTAWSDGHARSRSPLASRAFSAKPVMKSTLRPGRETRAASAICRPFRPPAGRHP